MKHFFPQIQVKTKIKKKRVFTKNGILFFLELKWRPVLRCTPESNYWKGCRCGPHSNYLEDSVKLLGGYIPPSLPGFGPPGFSDETVKTAVEFVVPSRSLSVGLSVTRSSLEQGTPGFKSRAVQIGQSVAHG